MCQCGVTGPGYKYPSLTHLAADGSTQLLSCWIVVDLWCIAGLGPGFLATAQLANMQLPGCNELLSKDGNASLKGEFIRRSERRAITAAPPSKSHRLMNHPYSALTCSISILCICSCASNRC